MRTPASEIDLDGRRVIVQLRDQADELIDFPELGQKPCQGLRRTLSILRAPLQEDVEILGRANLFLHGMPVTNGPPPQTRLHVLLEVPNHELRHASFSGMLS